MWLNDIELEKDGVRLVPLQKSHKNALLKAASDGELWNLWVTSVPSSESIDHYIDSALLDKEKNTALPFVVVHVQSDTIIGSTRYLNGDVENRRLEIGSTWYSRSYHRTGVNTLCKFLLLRHAFEKLDIIAVEFRTHWYNYESRKAIERLGAKQDGVLRNHKILTDGTLRDTVVFSIIKSEWPTVKKWLLYNLNKYKENS